MRRETDRERLNERERARGIGGGGRANDKQKGGNQTTVVIGWGMTVAVV